MNNCEELCAVPFTSLILEPTGEVSCCRMKGLRQPVGDLRKQSLDEIWNGPAIREWRRDFLGGKKTICSEEIRHRGCHQYNSPQGAGHDFREVQDRPPLRLGLNLNGACNLRCEMCGVWSMGNGFYDKPGLWKQIEALLSTVREIEMFGGEPFIQRDIYRVMDYVGRNNPACAWHITTNGNWKLTSAVKSRLDRLQFRKLVVSFDSLVPETYAKIRRGGDLQKLLKNMADLVEYDKTRIAAGRTSLNLSVNCTIQQLNWREIPELISFARKAGFSYAHLSFLYHPAELSLLSLSVAEREAILEKIVKDSPVDDVRRAFSIIRPLLESVSPLCRASIGTELKERLKELPKNLSQAL